MMSHVVKLWKIGIWYCIISQTMEIEFDIPIIILVYIICRSYVNFEDNVGIFYIKQVR